MPGFNAHTTPRHQFYTYYISLFIFHLSILLYFTTKSSALGHLSYLSTSSPRITGFLIPFLEGSNDYISIPSNRNISSSRSILATRSIPLFGSRPNNTPGVDKWRSLSTPQPPATQPKYRTLYNSENTKDPTPPNNQNTNESLITNTGNTDKWMTLSKKTTPVQIETTTDKDITITTSLKPGLVYDAIVKGFINSKYALVSTIIDDVQCILTNDIFSLNTYNELHSDVTLQNERSTPAGWYHSLRYGIFPITLTLPLSFDSNNRPYSKIAMDISLSNYPNFNRGHIVKGIPIIRHGDFIIFRSIYGTYHLSLSIDRFAVHNPSLKTMSLNKLFLPDEVVDLEIVSNPKPPYISTYLVSLPFGSPVRKRWINSYTTQKSVANKIPRIYAPLLHRKDSQSNLANNTYLSNNSLLNVKPPEPINNVTKSHEQYSVLGKDINTKPMEKHRLLASTGDKQNGKYRVLGNYNQIIKPQPTSPIIPTENVSLIDFLKSVDGQMDRISRYVFMKTHKRINLDCIISPNLAKRFYNVASQSEKFTDIDENLEIEELRSLTKPSSLKYPTVLMLGGTDSGKSEIFNLLCTNAKKIVKIDENDPIIGHNIGLATIDVGQRKYLLMNAPDHPAFTNMIDGLFTAANAAIVVISAVEGLNETITDHIKRCINLKLPLVVCITNCKDSDNTESLNNELSNLGLVFQPQGPNTLIRVDSELSSQPFYDALSTITISDDSYENVGGVVIDSGVIKGLGKYALIVLHDVLDKREYLVYNGEYVIAKRIFSLDLNPIHNAKPGDAVYITGLNSFIPPGTTFIIASNEQDAKTLEVIMPSTSQDESFEEFTPPDKGQVPAIVKSNSFGAAEALSGALGELLVEDTPIDIKFGPIIVAPGVVTTGDIRKVSPDGVLFLYDIPCSKDLLDIADKKGVNVISCDSMENILALGVDELEKRRSVKPLGGVLAGTATVGQVFDAAKDKKAAGFVVKSGKILGNTPVRVIRDGKVVFTGQIISLRRTKSEVATVSDTGGLTLKDFDDFMVGDIIECYSH